ncbi:organophopsphate acid anhydrase [Steroidobacter agaridevorans]|uniref:Organophopsphate acid anhydrase n=1 Tax=Steroidobacter agaridevorans TaxID=2695856 RepID=A0A829Y9X7_9GAMM|nr:amidohydrolase family protein [Steroidobacter agaridevorans]GFE80109.1 organophopsphate acid anhydrase [Steroidobacter agaridevorans]
MQLAVRVVAAFLGLAALSVAQAATTVLTNFTLIDGTGRAPTPGSALIVENGRISWVGTQQSLKLPSGATVVDLAGKFVTPGLIDNHVHVGLVHDLTQDINFYSRELVEQQLRIYAAYGVTAVQVLGTDTDVIFGIRADQRKAPTDMARVYTSGQGLVFKGSYGGVAGLNKPVANVAEARQAVDEQVAKGVDFIKLWVDDEFGDLPSRMPADISKAIIDQAHKHGLRAIAHIFYLQNAKTLASQGVDGFAHSVRDLPVDQALLDDMKRHDIVQMAATLSREASFTYTKLPFLDDPFFNRSITPAALATLKSPERQQKLAAGKHFAQYPGVLDTALKNTRREIEAGVRYGVGSDSGPSGRFSGHFLHWEMELMVQAGLSPLQVLTAATSTNAKLIGAKDLGTIEPGKSATLLVLDADPVADIRNTRTIHAVYVAGKPVSTIWSVCTGRAANECKGGSTGGAHGER